MCSFHLLQTRLSGKCAFPSASYFEAAPSLFLMTLTRPSYSLLATTEDRFSQPAPAAWQSIHTTVSFPNRYCKSSYSELQNTEPHDPRHQFLYHAEESTSFAAKRNSACKRRRSTSIPKIPPLFTSRTAKWANMKI